MDNHRHFVRFAKKAASRKRATKACLKCRRRKVRCDVTRTSAPCTNCRLDGDECVVARRGSSIQMIYDERAPSTPDRGEDDPQDLRSPSPRERRLTSPAARTNDVVKTRCHAFPRNTSPAHHIGDTEMLGVAHDAQGSMQQPLQPQLKALYSSMPFLKALNIRDCDFSQLDTRGCLRVPAKPILDEFIRHYFLYVHPLLPLMNEADFWEAYDTPRTGADTNTKGTPVSLLLLQAMMFASCTFVTKESLRVLGFSSIHAAKESFYTKAKLLHDFATDSDPISIAQAALLLTYWCPTFRSGPRKPNSRWLRIAVQNAKSVNADKYATIAQGLHATPEDMKRQNILKRVWWCCIIRDRIMPLCVRRNIQITRAHWDFDSHSPLGYDDLVDELESSRVYGVATKHTLIMILERLTELCARLTDVLCLVYPTEHLPVLDAEAHSTAFSQVQEYRRALQNWAEVTPPPLANKDLAPDTGSFEDSVVLFTNLVWIYYHCASASRVALYNYELHLGVILGLATPEITSAMEAQFLDNNRQDLRNATKSIADCFSRLLPLRLTRWLPSSAVACSALPLALHMVDIKMSSTSSSPGEIWTRPAVAAKQSRLNILIQAFRELHPKYDGVDSISKTIRYFMECTYLEQSAPPPANEPTDVLARSPTYYLRLALTLDLSLSQDRLPNESDFPIRLRSLLLRTGSFMPMLFGQLGAGQMADGAITPPRPLSPSTTKNLTRWIEDDRSSQFALQMGIEITGWPTSLDMTHESTSVTDTSPRSDETQEERDSNSPQNGTENLLQSLQNLADWAENDQSFSFAQAVGLFPNNAGYSNQGQGEGQLGFDVPLSYASLDWNFGV
ncbi:cutinase transcription factor 1 beta [Fusarium albosuccineum]|uniref:Cutinase transcription factor 1 beta n=1 Tax=Fusarium albosuccineum TaxID=1237068 RepID=A0A8H4LAH1_9HYPO|nr:cutinase transcription factor 1 beta [Fusarium albosuccineum]